MGERERAELQALKRDLACEQARAEALFSGAELVVILLLLLLLAATLSPSCYVRIESAPAAGRAEAPAP